VRDPAHRVPRPRWAQNALEKTIACFLDEVLWIARTCSRKHGRVLEGMDLTLQIRN
jgi:hypothetical protein